MRCSIALVLFGLGLPAVAQQNAQPVDPAAVTAPVLLPVTTPIAPSKHCEALDGTVHLAATIDATGLAHISRQLDTSDQRLLPFGTELLGALRFKPGMIAGVPAAVPVELTLALHTCAQHEKHPSGDSFYRFTLRTHPMIAISVVPLPAAEGTVQAAPSSALPTAQIGGAVSAPVPVHIADPQLPVSAKLPKHGSNLLAVTIDANGIPQDVHVVQSLQPELDVYTVEAAKQWRFKPALRDGKVPVAVEASFAATFQYLDREAVATVFFLPGSPQKVLDARKHARKQDNEPEILNAEEVVTRYKPESRLPGRVLVSMVIGTDGVPRNVRAVKGLDSSLDLDTVAMVEHLRFKPVLLDDNTPVPVGYNLSIRYHGPVVKWRDILGDNLGFLMLIL